MLEASHMSRISAHSSVAPAVIASSLGFCGDSFAIDVSHFERLGMQSGIDLASYAWIFGTEMFLPINVYIQR